MFLKGKSLLTLLLAGTLVLVQTALPWLHVGCQHDHSAKQVASAHEHHRCYGHHHHGCGAAKTTDSQLAAHSRHEHLSSDDCAACRFSLLSPLAVQTTSATFVEQVSLLPAPRSPGIAACEPPGLYRSRAPPAIG
jgi:hypothetical protein